MDVSNISCPVVTRSHTLFKAISIMHFDPISSSKEILISNYIKKSVPHGWSNAIASAKFNELVIRKPASVMEDE